MFRDMQFDGFGQPVKPQAVFGSIDDVEQTAFEVFHLHSIDATFEYGFLYALANALTGARDAAQTPTAGAGFGGYIVANDDEHT